MFVRKLMTHLQVGEPPLVYVGSRSGCSDACAARQAWPKDHVTNRTPLPPTQPVLNQGPRNHPHRCHQNGTAPKCVYKSGWFVCSATPVLHKRTSDQWRSSSKSCSCDIKREQDVSPNNRKTPMDAPNLTAARGGGLGLGRGDSQKLPLFAARWRLKPVGIASPALWLP